MARRGHMSEVDSDLVILNQRLMGYVNVGMENTLDVAQNIAEYCSDDPNLKQKTRGIMQDFIQMEKDIEQTVSALQHVKSEVARSSEDLNLLTMFKDKLHQIQTSESQDQQAHPKFVEMEEIMTVPHGDIEAQLEVLRATLVGGSDDGEVAVTQAEVNIKCPFTGKIMVNPVRNVRCNHVYEKEGILEHMKARKRDARCPVGGCGNSDPIKKEHLVEHKEMKQYISLIKVLKKRT